MLLHRVKKEKLLYDFLMRHLSLGRRSWEALSVCHQAAGPTILRLDILGSSLGHISITSKKPSMPHQKPSHPGAFKEDLTKWEAKEGEEEK